MASALIFPSLYEGFGFPPLEAMASDCPVIASHAASIPEVCGEAAYWIDPKKPQELADAFGEIKTNPLLIEKLKCAGRKRIEGFTWNKTVEHYTRWVEWLGSQ